MAIKDITTLAVNKTSTFSDVDLLTTLNPDFCSPHMSPFTPTLLFDTHPIHRPPMSFTQQQKNHPEFNPSHTSYAHTRLVTERKATKGRKEKSRVNPWGSNNVTSFKPATKKVDRWRTQSG